MWQGGALATLPVLTMPATMKLAIGSLVVGLAVLAIKTLAYRTTGSVALLSDALESMVNVVAAAAALVAICVARRPAAPARPSRPRARAPRRSAAAGQRCLRRSSTRAYDGYDADDSGAIEEPDLGDVGDDIGDGGLFDV